MSSLTAVDYAILIVVTLSTVIGFFRGAVREIISLVALVVAIAVTLHQGTFLSTLLPHVIINPTVDPAVMKIIVFVTILILFSIAGRLLHHVVGVLGAGFFDHLFGGFFGLIRAVFLSVFCIIFLSHALRMPLWKKSLLFPPMLHWNCQLMHSSSLLDKGRFFSMC